MKKRRVFAVISAMFLSVSMLFTTGIATKADESKNGLEVTLETDKESYLADEEVKISVSIKNAGDTVINNISVDVSVPEGVKVAEESDTSIKISTLPAGETVEQNITAEAAVVTDASDIVENSSVQTGDNTNTKSVVFILVLSGIIATFMIISLKSKKIKNTIGMLSIIVVFAGTTAMVTYAATIQFAVSKVITVDGKEKEIVAAVSYDDGEDHTVNSEEDPTVNAGEDPTVNAGDNSGAYYFYGDKAQKGEHLFDAPDQMDTKHLVSVGKSLNNDYKYLTRYNDSYYAFDYSPKQEMPNGGFSEAISKQLSDSYLSASDALSVTATVPKDVFLEVNANVSGVTDKAVYKDNLDNYFLLIYDNSNTKVAEIPFNDLFRYVKNLDEYWSNNAASLFKTLNLDDGTLSITGLTDAGKTYLNDVAKGRLVVPATIGDKAVSEIGAGMIGGTYTDIIVSEGITSVGLQMTTCDNVVLPTTINSASQAFAESRIKNVTLAEGTTTIPDAMFRKGISGYIDNVNIPVSVTSISASAFGEGTGTSQQATSNITYAGTKEQWGAIGYTKPEKLRPLTVHCTDGDLTI